MNNLCIQALRFGSDLADPIEQNRKRSTATFCPKKSSDFSGTPKSRQTFGGIYVMHQCTSYLFESPEGSNA